MKTGFKQRPVLLGFIAWTGVGLAFGTQIYFIAAGIGRPIPWIRGAAMGLKDWYLWALLSLLIWELVDRYPFERRSFWKSLGTYVGSCACVVIAVETLSFLISKAAPGIFFLDSGQGEHDAGSPAGQASVRGIQFAILSFKGVFDATIFWLLVSVRYAFNYSRRLQERYRVEAELKASLTEARLHALKMQLQPHFLFNTLNAIAALTRQDPKTAELMVGSLSEMLRTTLYMADRQEVSLREEMDFVNCYLSIEQLRFGDRLATRQEVAPEVWDALVPPMILQPIVENAVRHGVEPNLADSVLIIKVRQEGDDLVIVVQDNGSGFKDQIEEGIGLRNTRARLHQLYGGQNRLLCEPAQEGGAKVSLVLPLRQAEPSVAKTAVGSLKP
jgi:two-component system, LytTR family, sensor kinase